LGKDYDGGYLANLEDVKKTDRLYSLGIGNDISFEEDFAEFNNCTIDAYDGTIETPPFSFFTGNRRFHRENIVMGRMNKIIGNAHNVFLKCDIEGSEYEILDELIENSFRFSGMVIEFHEIHKYHLFNELTSFIAKIDLKLIHVHANNNSYTEILDEGVFIPDCIELTFTSSKNIEYRKHIELPHKLDMPNAKEREDFRIVF
jgi:hypothetical protein